MKKEQEKLNILNSLLNLYTKLKSKELNAHQDSSVELFFSVGQLLEIAIERLE